MNETLKAELEAMRTADQALRVEAMEIAKKHGRESPEYLAFRPRGLEQDARHQARLVEIVEAHGWPGVGLVGEEAASGAFLMLQHAAPDAQKRYLPMFRAATESGDVPPSWLPLLEDRVLLHDGEKQRYGTQIVPGPDGKPRVWPIEDEEHVDERRAAVGLEPLAAYLKRFGL